MTLVFFLSFSVPVATILGESEIYLDAGSTINITCVVKHTPVPPSNVQWEHQGKVRQHFLGIIHTYPVFYEPIWIPFFTLLFITSLIISYNFAQLNHYRAPVAVWHTLYSENKLNNCLSKTIKCNTDNFCNLKKK